MLPDDRLRDVLRAEGDRTQPDPAFLDTLYAGQLAQERVRRRSPWLRFTRAMGPILAPATALAAALVVAIVAAVVLGPRGTEPAATLAPTPSAAASPTISPLPSALGSGPVEPTPSGGDLGLGVGDVPSWLVPAGAVRGLATSPEDASWWSQAWRFPRDPAALVADIQARFAGQGIRVSTTTAQDRTTIQTSGVSPSIVVTIGSTSTGSIMTARFDPGSP